MVGEMDFEILTVRARETPFPYMTVELIQGRPGSGEDLMASIRRVGIACMSDELGLQDPMPFTPPIVVGTDDDLGAIVPVEVEGGKVIFHLAAYRVQDIVLVIALIGLPGFVEAPMFTVAEASVRRARQWLLAYG